MFLPAIVKSPILKLFHATVRANLVLRPRDYQYVFVLAHMRSGSTVLSHILVSHPGFDGAGETHTFYKTPEDMGKLVPRTCELLRKLQVSSKYVVDKITMDQYLSDEILALLPIYKGIILFREPEAALKSIVDFFKWPQEMALDHYVTRLATLARYGRVLCNRAMVVEYDELIEQPREVLTALTRFFDIDPPFKEVYAKTKVTGKMGDPSSNILTGKIVRTPEHKLQINTDVLAEAVRAVQKCRHELLSAGVLPAVDHAFHDAKIRAKSSP